MAKGVGTGDTGQAPHRASHLLTSSPGERVNGSPTKREHKLTVQFCEKCLHRPAIELRDAAQKRKNKAKPKKRKEEDEFELDEVEKANALGGWLQVRFEPLVPPLAAS